MLCMKTILKVGIAACCVAVLSTALLDAQLKAQDTKINNDCTPWIETCLKDFATINAGMTRGEIEKKFPMDGGLQVFSPVRFTHPACPYFKIDVEFEVKSDGAEPGRPVWGKDNKVTKVSKPYIERPFMD